MPEPPPAAHRTSSAETSFLLRAPEPQELDSVRALLEARELPTAGLDDIFMIVAQDTDDEAIVACGAFEVYGDDEVGLVRSLLVTSNHGGLGLSQLVTEGLEFAARAQGLSDLYLFTDATALFTRLGWAPADPAPAATLLDSSVEWQHNHGGSKTTPLLVKHLRARSSDELRQLIHEHFETLAKEGTTGFHRPNVSYPSEHVWPLPAAATDLMLGCGHPFAFERPKPGATVLDLGCGSGVDALLAAQRVGPAGRVHAIDMVPEMVERVRDAAEQHNSQVVEAHVGLMEQLPFDDASIDLVGSNGSINLSQDKPAVLAEAFRVLKPGGRLVVCDVVTGVDLPDALRADPVLVCAGLGGALLRADYLDLIAETGFIDVTLLRDVDFTTFEGVSTRSVTITATKPPAPGSCGD